MFSSPTHCATALRRFAFAVTLLSVVASLTGARAGEAERSPASFSWAGAYTGLNAGVGIPLQRGERLEAASGFAASSFDLLPVGHSREAPAFGAQFGYNWQIGRWVYGLETDFGFLDGDTPPTGAFLTPPAFGGLGANFFSLNYSPTAKYMASFRGRLGFAFDRTLVYATGGVASGGARGAAVLEFEGATLAAPFHAQASQSSRMKYVIGGGVEHALTEEWSARAEYFFVSRSLNSHIFSDEEFHQFVSRRRKEDHLLRLGLNYHFGDAEAKRSDRAEGGPSENAGAPERYSVHAQTTNIVQSHPRFHARYSGPASFNAHGETRGGSTSTGFFGVRLWDGAEAYVNPEVIVGYGINGAIGAGAYVNGSVARVGHAAPYLRFQRYFLRQTIGLGGESEEVASGPNQMAGRIDADRLIFTIGKFGVLDIFDDNKYAHDFNRTFLNFTISSMGAFDFAADAWGYTNGAAAEWKQDWWTARVGVFQGTEIPNGLKIEPVLFRQFMSVAEFEARYALFDRPGKIRLLAYAQHGLYSKAQDVTDLALATGTEPDVNNLRKRSTKFGGGVNLEQELTPSLGVFLRASVTDGRFETIDYTDVDHSLAAGLSLSGESWGRADDVIGLGATANGLIAPRVRYFQLGGRSDHIGDGGLSYGTEAALETYYRLALGHGAEATLNYQFMNNPAYNRDRGPVSFFGLRLRSEF
jgi:high affinity Mn2+ porin